MENLYKQFLSPKSLSTQSLDKKTRISFHSLFHTEDIITHIICRLHQYQYLAINTWHNFYRKHPAYLHLLCALKKVPFYTITYHLGWNFGAGLLLNYIKWYMYSHKNKAYYCSYTKTHSIPPVLHYGQFAVQFAVPITYSNVEYRRAY